VALSAIPLGGVGGGGVTGALLPLPPLPPQAVRNTNIIGSIRNHLAVDEIEIISIPVFQEDQSGEIDHASTVFRAYFAIAVFCYKLFPLLFVHSFSFLAAL
jgi:hypothetical protein